MSDRTVTHRDVKALDDAILGLRRAIRHGAAMMTDEERREADATLMYFWNYCVSPHLIELSDGTVLHIPESGQPDKNGHPRFCTECGHGAYVKGEDLCGNCLPMEWHEQRKEDSDDD